MADKIVGPLTLIQFLYVAIGGSIAYILLTKASVFIFILVGIPSALFFLALAFYKPQDQPFSHFVGALISYSMKPKGRVWLKGSAEEAIILPHQEKHVIKPIAKKKVTKSDLQRIAEVLDSGGWKSLENLETFHTTKQEMATQEKLVAKELTVAGVSPSNPAPASQPVAKPVAQTPSTNLTK